MSGQTGISGVASDAFDVTPHDDNDLPKAARAIRCKPTSGAAGTLRITTFAGNVFNTEIALGELLEIGASRVHDTGTTATGLEALV